MESIGNTTIQTLEASNYSSSIDDQTHIFNGTPQSTTGYSNITTMVNASGAGTLKIHHSMDANTWDITDEYFYVEPNRGMFNVTPAKTRYFYVEFINTTNAVNSIRIQTFLRNDNSSSSEASYVTQVNVAEDTFTVRDLTVTADTSGIVLPPTTVTSDIRGREGWWYQSDTSLNINLYTKNTNEKQFTIDKLTGVYSVIVPETITGTVTVSGSPIVNMPAINITDTSGAYINYAYNSSANVFRLGEPVMLYTGYVPDTIHSTIPRVQINAIEASGNIIKAVDYIKLKSPLETTNVGPFLLQYSGFFDRDLGRVNETRYVNGKKRIIENTLSSLIASGGSLNVNLNSTANYKESLVYNGNISGNTITLPISWTRGEFGRNSVLSYKDTSPSVTDTVSLFTYTSVGGETYLGSAYPINISGGRKYCFTLNLLPFDRISIRNDSATTISDVVALLYSA
jgi:hypothetical protein